MIVETESSVYVLDLKAAKLKRYPRDSPILVENPRHGLPAVVAALRMDGEAIPFTLLAPLKLGQPAQFLLQIRDDGIRTIRTTTDVVRLIATEDVEWPTIGELREDIE